MDRTCAVDFFKVHCCDTEASLFIFLDLPNICLHISCGEHTFCNTASASSHSWFILVSPSWCGTDGWGLGAEECCPASDGCGSYAARLLQTALKRVLGKGPTWLLVIKNVTDLQRLEENQLQSWTAGHWSLGSCCWRFLSQRCCLRSREQARFSVIMQTNLKIGVSLCSS